MSVTSDTAAGFDPADLQDGLLIAPDPGSRTRVVVDFEGHSAEPEPVVVVVNEMEFDTVGEEDPWETLETVHTPDGARALARLLLDAADAAEAGPPAGWRQVPDVGCCGQQVARYSRRDRTWRCQRCGTELTQPATAQDAGGG